MLTGMFLKMWNASKKTYTDYVSYFTEITDTAKQTGYVQPYADKEPNLVLIEGLRGGKSRIEVERPLIVYEKTGVYTDEILDIYGRNHEEKL